MIKKIIGTVLTTTIMMTSVQAFDKNLSYKIINQCKYEVDGTGKNYDYIAGLLVGLGYAYLTTLREGGIDNNFASLTPGQFSKKMCEVALAYRKEENKKTGGKYDVTGFYSFLVDIGYLMTLPPSKDTDTTN